MLEIDIYNIRDDLCASRGRKMLGGSERHIYSVVYLCIWWRRGDTARRSLIVLDVVDGLSGHDIVIF